MGMYDLLAPVKIPASDPLTLDVYTDFVLIPYIAASLIAEDRETDIDGAWEIMQREGDHGDDENPSRDDDPILDAVYAANARRRKAAMGDSGRIGQLKQKTTRDTRADKENANPAVC
jgi:hypothetical protein